MNKKWYVVGLAAILLVSLSFIFWKTHFPLDHQVAQFTTPNAPEKILPPQIKRAVNQALAPAGVTYPKTENAQGITIDVSKRAASVSTAVIDEKGQLHIVDYTSPIKE